MILLEHIRRVLFLSLLELFLFINKRIVVQTCRLVILVHKPYFGRIVILNSGTIF